jgi:hypothetical protein
MRWSRAEARAVETIVVSDPRGWLRRPAPTTLRGHFWPDRRYRQPARPDAVDVVISGHTHQAYNCVINNKLVTSASSFGRLVTDIDLTIDRKSAMWPDDGQQCHRHPRRAEGIRC